MQAKKLLPYILTIIILLLGGCLSNPGEEKEQEIAKVEEPKTVIEKLELKEEDLIFAESKIISIETKEDTTTTISSINTGLKKVIENPIKGIENFIQGTLITNATGITNIVAEAKLTDTTFFKVGDRLRIYVVINEIQVDEIYKSENTAEVNYPVVTGDGYIEFKGRDTAENNKITIIPGKSFHTGAYELKEGANSIYLVVEKIQTQASATRKWVYVGRDTQETGDGILEASKQVEIIVDTQAPIIELRSPKINDSILELDYRYFPADSFSPDAAITEVAISLNLYSKDTNNTNYDVGLRVLLSNKSDYEKNEINELAASLKIYETKEILEKKSEWLQSTAELFWVKLDLKSDLSKDKLYLYVLAEDFPAKVEMPVNSRMRSIRLTPRPDVPIYKMTETIYVTDSKGEVKYSKSGQNVILENEYQELTLKFATGNIYENSLVLELWNSSIDNPQKLKNFSAANENGEYTVKISPYQINSTIKNEDLINLKVKIKRSDTGYQHTGDVQLKYITQSNSVLKLENQDLRMYDTDGNIVQHLSEVAADGDGKGRISVKASSAKNNKIALSRIVLLDVSKSLTYYARFYTNGLNPVEVNGTAFFKPEARTTTEEGLTFIIPTSAGIILGNDMSELKIEFYSERQELQENSVKDIVLVNYDKVYIQEVNMNLTEKNTVDLSNTEIIEVKGRVINLWSAKSYSSYEVRLENQKLVTSYSGGDIVFSGKYPYIYEKDTLNLDIVFLNGTSAVFKQEVKIRLDNNAANTLFELGTLDLNVNGTELKSDADTIVINQAIPDDSSDHMIKLKGNFNTEDYLCKKIGLVIGDGTDTSTNKVRAEINPIKNEYTFSTLSFEKSNYFEAYANYDLTYQVVGETGTSTYPLKIYRMVEIEKSGDVPVFVTDSLSRFDGEIYYQYGKDDHNESGKIVLDKNFSFVINNLQALNSDYVKLEFYKVGINYGNATTKNVYTVEQVDLAGFERCEADTSTANTYSSKNFESGRDDAGTGIPLIENGRIYKVNFMAKSEPELNVNGSTVESRYIIYDNLGPSEQDVNIKNISPNHKSIEEWAREVIYVDKDGKLFYVSQNLKGGETDNDTIEDTIYAQNTDKDIITTLLDIRDTPSTSQKYFAITVPVSNGTGSKVIYVRPKTGDDISSLYGGKKRIIDNEHSGSIILFKNYSGYNDYVLGYIPPSQSNGNYEEIIDEHLEKVKVELKNSYGSTISLKADTNNKLTIERKAGITVDSNGVATVTDTSQRYLFANLGNDAVKDFVLNLATDFEKATGLEIEESKIRNDSKSYAIKFNNGSTSATSDLAASIVAEIKALSYNSSTDKVVRTGTLYIPEMKIDTTGILVKIYKSGYETSDGYDKNSFNEQTKNGVNYLTLDLPSFIDETEANRDFIVEVLDKNGISQKYEIRAQDYVAPRPPKNIRVTNKPTKTLDQIPGNTVLGGDDLIYCYVEKACTAEIFDENYSVIATSKKMKDIDSTYEYHLIELNTESYLFNSDGTANEGAKFRIRVRDINENTSMEFTDDTIEDITSLFPTSYPREAGRPSILGYSDSEDSSIYNTDESITLTWDDVDLSGDTELLETNNIPHYYEILVYEVTKINKNGVNDKTLAGKINKIAPAYPDQATKGYAKQSNGITFKISDIILNSGESVFNKNLSGYSFSLKAISKLNLTGEGTKPSETIKVDSKKPNISSVDSTKIYASVKDNTIVLSKSIIAKISTELGTIKNTSNNIIDYLKYVIIDRTGKETVFGTEIRETLTNSVTISSISSSISISKNDTFKLYLQDRTGNRSTSYITAVANDDEGPLVSNLYVSEVISDSEQNKSRFKIKYVSTENEEYFTIKIVEKDNKAKTVYIQKINLNENSSIYAGDITVTGVYDASKLMIEYITDNNLEDSKLLLEKYKGSTALNTIQHFTDNKTTINSTLKDIIDAGREISITE